MAFGQALGPDNPPKHGFVPNSQTAIRIAKAVLIPIYGVKAVKENEPFFARLEKGVWIVTGEVAPRMSNLTVEISQKSGRIRSVYARGIKHAA